MEAIVRLFNLHGDVTASWELHETNLSRLHQFLAALEENKGEDDVRVTIDIAYPPK